jgi:hypothetical protein
MPIVPPEPAELELLEDQLFEVNNEILQVEYERGVPIKVPLNDEEKGEWRIQEKAYGERVQKHTLNQKRLLPSSSANVPNDYRIKCMTTDNGSQSIKDKNPLSYTH